MYNVKEYKIHIDKQIRDNVLLNIGKYANNDKTGGIDMYGYCSKLKKNVTVNWDYIDSSTLAEKSKVKGLIDCKYAQNCNYYKENGKCELEK